jgi:hypothetical protein
MGQVSVSVKFPSNWKLNSSKSASVEVEDDALTELWILHTLPITWMSWQNIIGPPDKSQVSHGGNNGGWETNPEIWKQVDIHPSLPERSALQEDQNVRTRHPCDWQGM